ncbi:hypothetical protein BLNAU_5359 [Blattamonas nauphoetae]|uniref:Uncharacterized protein n=1 Tax=Blattamonas nauphoetae TaxID=2049346 RepID=A0ABQ9Y755_9EUKA|nr:hypothetical protein BLNAU_5359 [Blattamonas nauphoetae]
MEFFGFESLFPKSKKPFEEKAALFGSIVSRVRDNSDVDDAIQDEAVALLDDLKPYPFDSAAADRIVTELVPSTDGTLSGFVDSACILVSSPHSKIVNAALSFLERSFWTSSPHNRVRLIQKDFFSRILAIIQPQHLPLSENEDVFHSLNRILSSSIDLARPSTLKALKLDDPSARQNHLEFVFQQVIQQHSSYISFLCQNRHLVSTNLYPSWMDGVVVSLFQISPYHLPTLEWILTSPVVLTINVVLSSLTPKHDLDRVLLGFTESLREWKREGPEVIGSGKRMINALVSDGLEDTLEQLVRIDRLHDGVKINLGSVSILNGLGFNVRPF